MKKNDVFPAHKKAGHPSYVVALPRHSSGRRLSCRSRTAGSACNRYNSLINLQKVSKIYPMDGVVVNALSDISLTIKEGEFVSIIGPSGSGKSTLMHIIGCLDIPSHGKYILGGQDVSRLSEEALAKIRNQKIGFVFQAFNLLRRTPAIENVCLPLFYSGKNCDRNMLAANALSSVGLTERLNHLPSQLSGGEQQRVAIARALINNPLIILADEPTGNLDTRSGEEIINLFRRLHKEGKTVIIVTHDPDIAKIAKRIIRIKDGQLIS